MSLYNIFIYLISNNIQVLNITIIFQYYFRHNKPPPTEHILLPFDPDLIATPRKQPVDKLHYIWRTHILKPPVEVSFLTEYAFILQVLEKLDYLSF